MWPALGAPRCLRYLLSCLGIGVELLDGIHQCSFSMHTVLRFQACSHSLQRVFCVNCTRVSLEDRDEFDTASRSALGSELRYQVFLMLDHECTILAAGLVALPLKLALHASHALF